MAIYQISLNQRLLGQEVRNVLYYETVPDTFSSDEFTDVADLIRSDYAAVASRFVPEWSLYSVNFRRMDVPGLPGFEIEFTLGPLVGTNPGDPVATQIALLVSGRVFNTAAPNRIRQYIAGLPDASIVDGFWTIGEQGAQLVLVQTLDAYTTASVTWDRVAAHRDPVTDTVTEWNGPLIYSVSAVPATQRRRRIGVGI